MPVATLGDYTAVPRDRVENFAGKQLLYVSWDRHLLFAAPFLLCLPPETPFGEMLESALQPLLQADPDAAAIDWQAVEWLKGNRPWVPDFNTSLAANGIGHKEQLRLCTPALNSLCRLG